MFQVNKVCDTDRVSLCHKSIRCCVTDRDSLCFKSIKCCVILIQ